MYNIFFKLISTLPPELSHSLTIKLLKLKFWSKINEDDPSLYQHIFGLDFRNPIGLAAGFDKNVEVVESLLNLGFGFVEAGTITPHPQFGNSKPRIFRLLEDQAIINHLGFNNHGIKYAEKRLLKLNLNNFSKGIIGINIGINNNTSNAIEDYCIGLEKLGPLAHYITINISSPNTPGLRNLQNRGQIEELVKSLHRRKKEHSSLESKPILLKIAPDMNEEQLRDIALLSLASGIDGLIIGNSTVDRPSSLISKNKNEVGGLSGKPLFVNSTLMLKKMFVLTNGQIPLIGVGGISNGLEFYEKIKSGASLAQIYTALVYKGPNIINEIKQEILSCLKTDGFNNIKEAIGKDV
mgnify:CR=1 FL=1